METGAPGLTGAGVLPHVEEVNSQDKDNVTTQLHNMEESRVMETMSQSRNATQIPAVSWNNIHVRGHYVPLKGGFVDHPVDWCQLTASGFC